MRPSDQYAFLTPAERCQELARTLAAGLLRLRAQTAVADAAGQQAGPENSRESRPDCLELSGETVLSVQNG